MLLHSCPGAWDSEAQDAQVHPGAVQKVFDAVNLALAELAVLQRLAARGSGTERSF